MTRAWGYIIASYEDFSSATELYEFFKTRGHEALVEEGACYYKYEGPFDLHADLAGLVLMGCAFEDGWQHDGTVSRLFLQGDE